MGWQSKDPQDMSLEELQEAKQALAARFNEVQQEYNWLAAAIAHVDHQVGARFSLAGAPVSSPGGLPPYPIDRMSGVKNAPAPEQAEAPQG